MRDTYVRCTSVQGDGWQRQIICASECIGAPVGTHTQSSYTVRHWRGLGIAPAVKAFHSFSHECKRGMHCVIFWSLNVRYSCSDKILHRLFARRDFFGIALHGWSPFLLYCYMSCIFKPLLAKRSISKQHLIAWQIDNLICHLKVDFWEQYV